jgi:hypothetical protein
MASMRVLDFPLQLGDARTVATDRQQALASAS